MMTLLFGDNAYAKQQALQTKVAEVRQLHGEHAIEFFDGETLEARALADILQGVSLFAAEKTVVIRGAAHNKTLWEALGDWRDRLPDGTDVILVESAPDKRTKTFKQLQKQGSIAEYKTLSEPEVVDWLKTEAQKRGLNLSASLANKIIARAGTDQWRLSNELDKLSMHKVVDEKIIDALIEPTPQANVFSLLDAALQRQPQKLRELIAEAKPTEDPYMLFGLLSSQILQLAALVAAEGKSVDEVAAALKSHPFPLRKMQALARNTDKKALAFIVQTTATLDDNLKSTGLSPWVLLEQALIKIAARS